MTELDRRALLLGGSALALLAGCAERPLDVVDKKPPPAEGGIGGTGIVGVVTAFGSIVICGRRVLTDSTTSVSDAFGQMALAGLRRGHSLTVEASMEGRQLTARRIHVVHPVIGPVERVARDGRSLQVLGVPVVLEPGVQSLAQPGMRAAISGLWRGDRVVASRVDLLATDGPDVLAGTVTIGPRGFGIGGHPIYGPHGAAPEPGSFATALGEAREGVLVAREIMPGRFVGAAGPLQSLLIEGYLEPIAEAPNFTVSGLGHSFDPAARLAPLAGGRALFIGTYTGDFTVQHGLPLPEGQVARRDALPAGLDLASTPAALSTR